MKKHTFTVTLTFSEDVSDHKVINHIGETIAGSLKHTADTLGILGDDVEGYTKKIEVTHQVKGMAQVTNTINIA